MDSIISRFTNLNINDDDEINALEESLNKLQISYSEYSNSDSIIKLMIQAITILQAKKACSSAIIGNNSFYPSYIC